MAGRLGTLFGLVYHKERPGLDESESDSEHL